MLKLDTGSYRLQCGFLLPLSFPESCEKFSRQCVSSEIVCKLPYILKCELMCKLKRKAYFKAGVKSFAETETQECIVAEYLSQF